MERPCLQAEDRDGLCLVHVEPEAIAPQRCDTVRALGYADDSIDDHFSALIDEETDHLLQLCDIRAGYRIMPPEWSDGKVGAGGVLFETGPVIAAHFTGAHRILLFVCTIGDCMESRSRELFREGDGVRGHFADTVASLAAERLAQVLHDNVAVSMAALGWGVTNRFSPGYCGWSVAGQRGLFSLLPQGFCGVTLGESALMSPIKSVSGIIGAGEGVRLRGYGCEQCNRKECAWRKRRARMSRA